MAKTLLLTRHKPSTITLDLALAGSNNSGEHTLLSTYTLILPVYQAWLIQVLNLRNVLRIYIQTYSFLNIKFDCLRYDAIVSFEVTLCT